MRNYCGIHYHIVTLTCTFRISRKTPSSQRDNILYSTADTRSMAHRVSRVSALRLSARRLSDHTENRTQSGSGLVCGDRAIDGSAFFGTRGKLA